MLLKFINVMDQLKLFIFSAILLLTSTVLAHDKTSASYCNITEKAINDYEPNIFSPTNNLLRTTGQTAMYCGEKIIVYGRVLDQNCVPVPDAKIYAWQANCTGKYTYQPLKTRIDKNLIEINNNSTFTGNGTATTNNQGEFYFITSYPPAMHGYSSHVNIKIEHNMFGKLQTRLILQGKKANNMHQNPELNALIKQSGAPVYAFEIVLHGSGIKDY